MFKIITLAALILAGIIWALRRRPKVIAKAKENLAAPEQAAPPLAQDDSPTSANLRAAFAAYTEPGLRGTMMPEAAGPTDSRIGGPLVWPKGETLPVDETGRAFVLLAQVNLAALPAPLDLPPSGLLQILITADEMYGCEFPSHQNAGMRVVLHPADATFVPCPGPIASPDASPIYAKELSPEGQKIAWEQVACPPSLSDARILDAAFPIPRPNKADKKSLEAIMVSAIRARGTYDIMLRGNPDFTQSDPREEPALEGMLNLIAFSSTGGAFMWGDTGEACFLIPPADLPKANLSGVLYYWDCC